MSNPAAPELNAAVPSHTGVVRAPSEVHVMDSRESWLRSIQPGGAQADPDKPHAKRDPAAEWRALVAPRPPSNPII